MSQLRKSGPRNETPRATVCSLQPPYSQRLGEKRGKLDNRIGGSMKTGRPCEQVCRVTSTVLPTSLAGQVVARASLPGNSRDVLPSIHFPAAGSACSWPPGNTEEIPPHA